MAYLTMNSNMTILIVDSQTSNAEFLKQCLKKMGYKNFVTKENGLEAMVYLRQNNTVDYIFCRHKLPVMSGVDFLLELKADLSIGRVPFTMFSEKLDEGEVALLEEINIDALLTLPFAMKELAEKLSATWSRYIDENNVEFQFEKGRRLYLQDKLDEAAQVFRTLSLLGKIPTRAKVALARVERRKGNLETAKELCQEVLLESPEFVHAHQLLGEVELDLKNAVNALQHFAQALSISPKNPFRYLIIGEIMSSLKMWDDALNIYKRAAEQGVDAPELLEGSANALMNLGRKNEAVSILLRLSQQFPKNFRYHNNLAVCYKNLGNRSSAIEAYKRALELEPENPKILYNLGLLYVASDKQNAAKGYFKRAVDLDSSFEKARLKLLQIEDESAYLIEIEKLSQTNMISEFESEEPIASTKRELVVGEDDQKRLKRVAETYKDLSSLKVSPGRPQILQLDKSLLEKIASLDENQARDGYFRALSQIRTQFATAMESWFQEVGEISETLVQSILDNVNVMDAMENNEDVRSRISAIVADLQFQDHLKQSLDVAYKGFVSTCNSEVGEDVWQAISDLLPSEEERGLFRRVLKTGLSWAAQLDYPAKAWTVYQTFLIEHIGDVFTRMQRSNKSLAKHITVLMEVLGTDEDAKLKVNSVLDSSLREQSAAGLNQLQGFLEESSVMDEVLNALLGTVQHSIYLQNKLERFKSIAKHLQTLHLPELRLSSLKELFRQFRPNLSHIWRYCEAECATPEERALFTNQAFSKPGSNPKAG